MDNYRANGDFGGQSKVLKRGCHSVTTLHCTQGALCLSRKHCNQSGVGWDTLKYDWNRCLRPALFVFWLLHLLHRIFVYATWETVQIGAQPSFLVFISKHKIDRKIFLFSYWIKRCSRCRSQKKNFSQTLEFFCWKYQWTDQQNISFSKILVRIEF